jgi:hypothetical protein
MILRSDVIEAYRTVLGREPESGEVIDNQLSTADSIPELYRNFIPCVPRRSSACLPVRATAPLRYGEQAPFTWCASNHRDHARLSAPAW